MELPFDGFVFLRRYDVAVYYSTRLPRKYYWQTAVPATFYIIPRPLSIVVHDIDALHVHLM